MAKLSCGSTIYKTPLRAGIAGCVVSFAETPGQAFVLTAAHVVMDLEANRGDAIYAKAAPNAVFGTLYSWSTFDQTPTVDAALINVDLQSIDPTISGLGVPAGFNDNVNVGDAVQFVSIGSPGVVQTTHIESVGTQNGISLSWIGPDGRETETYNGQILCDEDCSVEGDSGAIVFDTANNIVGMIVGAVAANAFGDGKPTRTVVTPIAAIRDPRNWYNRTMLLQAPPGPVAAAGNATSPSAATPVNPAAQKRGSFGIDSLNPVDAATLKTVTSLFSRPPMYWGRYFHAPGQINAEGNKDGGLYASGENALLRNGQIRLLPIARQTALVDRDGNSGAAHGQDNIAALFEVFSPAYLQGADPQILFFLDVEGTPEKGQPSLSADYYSGWADSIVAASAQASNGTVKVQPAIYGRVKDDSTWRELTQAIANGAPCAGIWLARYHAGETGQPRDWDDVFLATATALKPPVLAWQYGDIGDNFDTNQSSPAHQDVLLAGLIMPPP